MCSREKNVVLGGMSNYMLQEKEFQTAISPPFLSLDWNSLFFSSCSSMFAVRHYVTQPVSAVQYPLSALKWPSLLTVWCMWRDCFLWPWSNVILCNEAGAGLYSKLYSKRPASQTTR